MDPQTGEILALANWPTFNPNAFARADDDARRNRAIQTLYEPGSTFKIVTASAALEQHVDHARDDGRRPARATSRSGPQADPRHAHVRPDPFTDVIVKSSNVGAIKVGLRLGAAARSASTSAASASARRSAPDFRGETAGIVWNPAQLDASALASVSMGYQVGVTPLQMVTAVSSVANGGHLLEPRVVRAFIKDGRRIEVPHKDAARRRSRRTPPRR